jgi:hypothetical protein
MKSKQFLLGISALMSLCGLANARTVTIDVDQIRDISASCLTSPLPVAPTNAAKM